MSHLPAPRNICHTPFSSLVSDTSGLLRWSSRAPIASMSYGRSMWLCQTPFILQLACVGLYPLFTLIWVYKLFESCKQDYMLGDTLENLLTKLLWHKYLGGVHFPHDLVYAFLSPSASSLSFLSHWGEQYAFSNMWSHMGPCCFHNPFSLYNQNKAFCLDNSRNTCWLLCQPLCLLASM